MKKSLAFIKYVVLFGLATLMISCDDGAANNGTTEPECRSNEDCVNHSDGKTECDTKTNVCVKPGEEKTSDKCGNGHLDLGESCDLSDLNGKSCKDWSEYMGGELACNGMCEFDKSGCYECTDTDTTKCGKDQKCSSGKCVSRDHKDECGNGEVEGDEKCDGNNLNYKTCADVGFLSGKLKCNECAFDTSECNECTGNEQCTDNKICSNGKCESIPECGDNQMYVAKYNICANKVNNEEEWSAIVVDWYKNGEEHYLTPDGKHASFILMKDLELNTNKQYALLQHEFLGVFIGNGKTITITNPDPDKTSMNSYFFVSSKNAVIEDLNMNIDVAASQTATSLVSKCQDTVFNNVHVTGTIRAKTYTGGVVLRSYNCTFNDVSFSGNILSRFVGGLYWEGDATINNVNVDVTNTASYVYGTIGGLAGRMNHEKSIVKDSQISLKVVNNWSSQTPDTNPLFIGGMTGEITSSLDVENTQVSSIVDVDIKKSTYNSSAHQLYRGLSYYGGLGAKSSDELQIKNVTITADASVIISSFNDEPKRFKNEMYMGGIFAGAGNAKMDNVNVTINRLDSAPDVTTDNYSKTHKGLILGISYYSSDFRNISLHLKANSIVGPIPYIAYRSERTHFSNINLDSDYQGIISLGDWWLTTSLTNFNLDDLPELSSDSKDNVFDTIVYQSNEPSTHYTLQNSSQYESAAKTVEIMNNSLASKNPALPEGKYLPWIVNANGKPDLKHDATDEEMYTIP